MLDANELIRALPGLHQNKAETVANILTSITELVQLDALFVHGSYTRSNHGPASDLDVIAVIPTLLDIEILVRELPARVHSVAPVVTKRYTERFPWFGRLWTFYFSVAPAFAIDLGLITTTETEGFFVEPDAVILLDKSKSVFKRKIRCYREGLTAQKAVWVNLEFEIFHTLTKMSQSLDKGHLWNAIENVNVLRRILFELMRSATDPPNYLHVGRPERDIETALPSVADQLLEKTIPTYDHTSIVTAALFITQQLEQLVAVHSHLCPWDLVRQAASQLACHVER